MVTEIEPNSLRTELVACVANRFDVMQSNGPMRPVIIAGRAVDFLHSRNLLLRQCYPSNFYLKMISTR